MCIKRTTASLTTTEKCIKLKSFVESNLRSWIVLLNLQKIRSQGKIKALRKNLAIHCILKESKNTI